MANVITAPNDGRKLITLKRFQLRYGERVLVRTARGPYWMQVNGEQCDVNGAYPMRLVLRVSPFLGKVQWVPETLIIKREGRMVLGGIH